MTIKGKKPHCASPPPKDKSPEHKTSEHKKKTSIGGFRSLGTGLCLLVIPFVMALLYGFLIVFFSMIRYLVVPLYYPKILGNIISCNIKTLIFTFGLSLLGTLYHLNPKYNFVPKETLIWMIITFCVLTVVNIIMG